MIVYVHIQYIYIYSTLYDYMPRLFIIYPWQVSELWLFFVFGPKRVAMVLKAQ